MPLPNSTRIDIERFWTAIERSAEIGTGRPGGLSRLALSDTDKQMRDVFVGWCKEAGFSVRGRCDRQYLRPACSREDLEPGLNVLLLAVVTRADR